MFAYGQTGVFKTELATLLQQHFGARFGSRNLPLNFSSTKNHNELLSFLAKDCMLVIDDFHPTGSATDRERMKRSAGEYFRAVGNAAGRGRMRADRTIEAAKPPRCLPLATGEDLLSGQSLNARLLIVEIRQGDIRKNKLTICQHDANAGLYVQALSTFIMWLAPQLSELQLDFQRNVADLQKGFNESHARTSNLRAQLTATWTVICEFLLDNRIIASSELKDFQTRMGKALRQATEVQSHFGGVSDNPCLRFRELVRSALASGAAHLAGKDGAPPTKLEVACGWRHELAGREYQWRPQGARIGWVDQAAPKVELYLDPSAAYATAQRMATNGNAIEVGEQTLRRRLHEGKFLASTDGKRGTVTIRRTLQCAPKDVLHLKLNFLNLESNENG
jgi:hypothetical protein